MTWTKMSRCYLTVRLMSLLNSLPLFYFPPFCLQKYFWYRLQLLVLLLVPFPLFLHSGRQSRLQGEGQRLSPPSSQRLASWEWQLKQLGGGQYTFYKPVPTHIANIHYQFNNKKTVHRNMNFHNPNIHQRKSENGTLTSVIVYFWRRWHYLRAQGWE